MVLVMAMPVKVVHLSLLITAVGHHRCADHDHRRRHHHLLLHLLKLEPSLALFPHYTSHTLFSSRADCLSLRVAERSHDFVMLSCDFCTVPTWDYHALVTNEQPASESSCGFLGCSWKLRRLSASCTRAFLVGTFVSFLGFLPTCAFLLPFLLCTCFPAMYILLSCVYIYVPLCTSRFSL